jgi:hypothetical protein
MWVCVLIAFARKKQYYFHEDIVMNTIRQTVTIPPNRRLQLDLTLPDNVPAGPAEILVVLSPARQDKPPKSVSHLAGCLAGSVAFAGDSVALQKALRDEWQAPS